MKFRKDNLEITFHLNKKARYILKAGRRQKERKLEWKSANVIKKKMILYTSLHLFIIRKQTNKKRCAHSYTTPEKENKNSLKWYGIIIFLILMKLLIEFSQGFSTEMIIL